MAAPRSTTNHAVVFIILFNALVVSFSFALSTNNSARKPRASSWTPSNSSHGKQKPGTQASQKRRRGYDLRNSRGVRKNRKRPPRWETEGDALFFVSKDDGSMPEVRGDTPTEMLENLAQMKHQQQSEKKSMRKKVNSNDENQQKSLPPHLSWGTLSTGPILSPRLKEIHETPTPIQMESFGPITGKKNAVIAAATGSGKSLAYLVPLMCRVSRKNSASVMVVTPTLELAKQIQSVVDSIWTPTKNMPGSSVCIIQSSMFEEDSSGLVPDIEVLNTPIVAGTAGALLKWLQSNNKGKRILGNLETVVLDEADRILQTEAMARIEHDKRNGATDLWERKKRLQKSDANALFDMIASQGRTFFVGNRERVQLICASATVGRTLRRQVMELTDATSVEMGSVLVCADSRVGKDADERKSSLLPSTINHSYLIQDETEEKEGTVMIKQVLETIRQLPPGPTIVFPGKTGVKLAADTLLTECGMRHTKTLRDNIRETSKDMELDQASGQHEKWEETPVFVISEKLSRGLDIPNVAYVVLAGGPPNSPAAYAHLAGRTGRVGKQGRVITFVRDMKGAQRIVNISFKLGLSFQPLSLTGGIEDTSAPEEKEPAITEESANDKVLVNDGSPTLSKEELEGFTVPTLKEMLKDRGEKVSGRKTELVERLLNVA